MIVEPISSAAEGSCASTGITAAAAATTESKWTAASPVAAGMGTSRTVASVATASVPSEPTSSGTRLPGSRSTASRL